MVALDAYLAAYLVPEFGASSTGQPSSAASGGATLVDDKSGQLVELTHGALTGYAPPNITVRAAR